MKDVFTVSPDENLAGAQLEVLDAFGRLVYSEILSGLSGTLQIDANDCRDGFYFGRISTVDRAASYKIVVQK